MKAAVMMLSLVLAACAPWPYGVEPPPVAYAHREPKLPIIDIQIPHDQINSACHNMTHDDTKYGVDGCGLVATFACIVVWPQFDKQSGFGQGHIDAIFAHEKFGHCNDLVHNATGHGWYPAP